MPVSKRKRKRIKITSKQKKGFLIAIYSLGGICFSLMLFILSIYIGLFGKLPAKEDLAEIQQHEASQIYSSDNVLMGRYYFQNRTNVSINRIPENFIHALISTEDARFYKHHGIDTRSMFRVLFKSILLRNKTSGGGSTITQQLAKNLFPRKYYWKLTVPVAKIKEMIIARRLEKIYTKEEILELYLNTVPFGQNTFGIETASITYFNKKPEDLKTEESAVLVGLLKATSYYNPKHNEEKATSRRNTVLKQMRKYNYIRKDELDSLLKLPLNLNMRILDHNEGLAPYFREYVRLELSSMLDTMVKKDGSKYNLYTDGLKIYSTLDHRMQRFAEQAVNDHLPRLQWLFDKQWESTNKWKARNPQLLSLLKKTPRYIHLKRKGLREDEIIEELQKPVDMKIFTWEGEKDVKLSPVDSVIHHMKYLQVGLLVIDARSGQVKAWVGGINHKYFKFDHVLSKRQVGSTFKPFVYAAAIENGAAPCTLYANDSISYEEYDNWTPRNANRRYGGYYSVKGALIHSVNTVSVKLIMETGIEKVIELAHKAGIKSELPPVPSLALGSADVSLFEMTASYAAFNSCRAICPYFIDRIEDKHGKVIYKHSEVINTDTVISEKTAQYMTYMLKNVVDFGTASSARTVYGLKGDFAGKTGTTQNQTDGWFIGYSPDLIAGAWVGGEMPSIRFRSLYYGQGSFTALPVWIGFMKRLYDNPNYTHLRSHTFHLNDSIYTDFDCSDYQESISESLLDFIERHGLSVRQFIREIFKQEYHEKRQKKDRNKDKHRNRRH